METSQRFYILTAVQALLAHCHLSDSPLVPTRLAKAVLPSLSILLVAPSETQTTEESSQSSKKGKKRARGYEGDEVFRLTKELICPGPIEGKVLLSALEVVRLVLRNPNLSPAMQSISARVLLSILLALPELSPASLSTEPKLHTDLLQLVKTINTELGSGTSSVMSKSLGLVLRTVMLDDNYTVLRDMDILVHPRAPPLVRSLPHVESLSLFRAEESQEEAQTREELGLHGAFPLQPKKSDSDVVMEDAPTQLQATKSTNEVQPATILEPLAPPRPPVPISSIANEPGPAPAPQTTKPVPIRSEPSRIQPPEAKKIPQPVPARPQPTVAPTQTEEVEDEEMPSINMESDSDEE
ncbi:hypothetical protein H0H93_000051 [Arthromyces matolae]|nr:hypothetical protein H0H93_000051 [Arthromyces matolae]